MAKRGNDRDTDRPEWGAPVALPDGAHKSEALLELCEAAGLRVEVMRLRVRTRPARGALAERHPYLVTEIRCDRCGAWSGGVTRLPQWTDTEARLEAEHGAAIDRRWSVAHDEYLCSTCKPHPPFR